MVNVVSQEISCLLQNQKVYYCVHNSHHWSLSRLRWIQSTPSNPISLKSILILSSISSLQAFQPNIWVKHRSCAGKEICLYINTEKTKCMFMPLHQTTGQNWYIKATDKSFENLAKVKYLRMIVTNQNCIYEEIKSRLNLHFRIFSLPICHLKLAYTD
jgi:hypothetical protein